MLFQRPCDAAQGNGGEQAGQKSGCSCSPACKGPSPSGCNCFSLPTAPGHRVQTEQGCSFSFQPMVQRQNSRFVQNARNPSNNVIKSRTRVQRAGNRLADERVNPV